MRSFVLFAFKNNRSGMLPRTKKPALLVLVLFVGLLSLGSASCPLGTYNNKICSGNGKCSVRNLCECDSRHTGFDCSQRTSSLVMGCWFSLCLMYLIIYG